jgi:hypothetical protein
MGRKAVTPAVVTLPMDKYPHIEFGVTAAAVTPKCIMCGTEISGRARTCGANCRKRASRRKEAIKREVQAVQDALNNLARFIDRWPDLNAEIMSAMNDCVTAATVTYFGEDYED